MTTRQMEPGSVGMFLESSTPFFAVRAYVDGEPRGWWSGYAETEGDALRKASAVADSASHKTGIERQRVTLGNPAMMTAGERAALLTNTRDEQ